MTIKEIRIQLALGSLSTYDKLKLASNKRASKKILTILSKDKVWGVRYYVAHNSNTPKEVLKKLSTDKDKNVRRYVALNLNTPIKVLKKLSTDEDSDVKFSATRVMKFEGKW